MKKEPKYTFIHTGNKTICITYLGKQVIRATAKCDPRDTYDEKRGEELAKIRCDLKATLIKLKEAAKECDKAYFAQKKANAEYAKRSARFNSLFNEYDDLVEKEDYLSSQ